MGHKALQNAHPKKYGKGGRLCRVCGTYGGVWEEEEGREEGWWVGKQRRIGWGRVWRVSVQDSDHGHSGATAAVRREREEGMLVANERGKH